MNKKTLVGTTATLALLVLFLMAISPVMAITKAPYWEHVQFTDFGAPDKYWEADGIVHLEDMHWSGSYAGTLGSGTMDVWYEHLMLSTKTGKGTFIATWLITIGADTMSGSANGKIIGGLYAGTSEGYFRGTHGTGGFEHIEKMGTFLVNLATATLDAEGVIIYH
ncbi:hypothetical protein MUP01_05615 [Candidatus Bathyarchaeota archaeon]|nr:hypothetical protein [Candidatus Bathyarchaeota archaeon]